MTTNPERQGERLAVLETQAMNIEKKVDEGFAAVSHQIAELSASIIARNALVDARFVNKAEYDNRKAAIEKQLSNRWVNNTLSAILGTVLTSLIGTLVYLIAQK